MIFPLAMAWAYLLALGEKLHESFFEFSKSSSSEQRTTSTAESSTSGSNSSSSSTWSSHPRQSQGHYVSPGKHGGTTGVEVSHPNLQQHQQRQQQKQLPNRLEFSLCDFLRSKLHDTPFLSSRLGGGKCSTPTSSTTGSAAPCDRMAPIAPPLSKYSSSFSSGSWPLRLRLGGRQQQQQQEQQEQQQLSESGLLPLSSRPRTTDKTLVLDLDETLIHAGEDLSQTGDGRFDFMVVLPPRTASVPAVVGHQSQKLGGRSLCPGGRGSSTSSGKIHSGTGGSGLDPAGKTFSRQSSRSSFGAGERRIYVRKRPHLRAFLEAVSKEFEIVVFTAARAEFVSAVLDEIDPGRELVDHVLSRESCTRLKLNGSTSTSRRGKDRRSENNNSSGNSGLTRRSKRGSAVVKDLGIIGRHLSKVIMVENSWESIRYHLENGVHISSFYGDREDTELLFTLESLKTLAPAADVRDGIIRLYVQTRAREEGHTVLPGALTVTTVPVSSSSESLNGFGRKEEGCFAAVKA